MLNCDTTVLDDPVGESLRGHHAHLARRLGRAATFLPEVATFCTVTAEPAAHEWADLARLLGRGQLADMFSCAVTPPPEWEPVFAIEGRQMIWTGDDEPGRPPAEVTAGVVGLGAADVPEMLELTARTEPGPFWPRTRELGTYLGIRDNGTLVAMAGERLRPPGWTEISAVCTAPEARGRGHATRLLSALIMRITARGETPFLHVAAANSGAIARYETLGFTTRQTTTFRGYRTP